MAQRLNVKKSLELLKKAERLIPARTQTLSKGPGQYVEGACPAYLQRGSGSHVWDVDGNEYIDLVLALGPVTLGYSYPAVNEAIIRQLKDGISFSLMHPLEVEVSEMLTKIIPCAEMVRFGKNGGDVTSAAVRAARAHTGREKIAYCGYHGWHDWYIVTTSRNKGVLPGWKKYAVPFEYNKMETLEKAFAANKGQIAGVIMEPIGVTEPKDGFLKEVKKLTRENGAVLIFDEVVTGFRVALGGAQEYYGVTPDLACVGKGMSNGMPLSAVVGKAEIMGEFDEIFFSTTFGGEALSLAAAKATIEEMKGKNVIKHFWKQGARLRDGYNRAAQELGLATECQGLPVHTVMAFKESKEEGEALLRKSLFVQEMAKRGVLCMGTNNVCYSHSDDDMERAVTAAGESLSLLKGAVESRTIPKLLEGKVAKDVFRRPQT